MSTRMRPGLFRSEMAPDGRDRVADLGDGGEQLIARYVEPLRPLVDGRGVVGLDRLRGPHL